MTNRERIQLKQRISRVFIENLGFAPKAVEMYIINDGTGYLVIINNFKYLFDYAITRYQLISK